MLLRSEISPIIPVALLVAAFYFLVVRPTKTRQERAQEVEDHLGPGVEIMTSAGLFGTVVSVGEDRFVLEIAPGVHATFLKAAVAKIHGIESAKKSGKGRKATPGKGGKAGGAVETDAPSGQDTDEPGPKTL